MRKRMGVLLMEEVSGEIAVQVFEDPEKAGASFGELKGRAGEAPRRATFLRLEYSEGGVAVVSASAKDLPVVVSAEDAPTGFVIGEGPRRD